MRTLFVADTHFGQERTLQLSKRPFRSVADMNRELVENWNIYVSERDAVYYLGDFGDPEIISRLNCSQFWLIAGNYDTPEVLEELRKDPRVRVILPDKPPLTVIPPDDVGLPQLKLIHEPEKADDPDAFYLFGHIHKLQMVKQNGLNVGVDCHHFHPIGYKTVKFYYDAITQHYDHNVFMGRMGKPIC